MPKSFSEKQIKGFSEAQTRTEMLGLLTDFPDLKDANVMDGNGVAPPNSMSAYKLLRMFRDNQFSPTETVLLGTTILCLRLKQLSLTADPTEISDASPEQIEALQTESVRDLKESLAFAKAAVQRAVALSAKPYFWGQAAAKIQEELDPKIAPEVKELLIPLLEAWFQKTIDANKDGLSASLDGLARLLLVHREDDEDSVSRAFDLFMRAAERGYYPAMNTLTDFVLAEDSALDEESRQALLDSLKKGLAKKSEGWKKIEARISAYRPETPEHRTPEL